MRRVLVTGVSRGLGLAIATRLLDDGVGVVGISRGDAPDALGSRDGFRHVAFDLSDVGQIRTGVFGGLDEPLDGLVNNAALAVDDLVTSGRLDDLERMFRVNVLAAIELSNHVIRNMLVHRTRGSLVHISSIAARVGFKGLAMYGATKGALESFSRGAAREWGPRGIRSNCVAAGFLDVGMSDRLSEDARRAVMRRTSLGQPTAAADVVDVVVGLIGGMKTTTGQTFVVDAGSTA